MSKLRSAKRGHIFAERMYAFEVVRESGEVEVHLSPVINMPAKNGPIQTRDELERLLTKALRKDKFARAVLEVRGVKNLKDVRDVEWFLEGLMFQMLDFAEHPNVPMKKREFYFIGRRDRVHDLP
jgi:hypothetical protein